MTKPVNNRRKAKAYDQAVMLIQTLEEAGFKARMVGGCVRDRQLGLAPKDYDIATDATPEAVASVFGTGPWKVIPTGIAHGTVTVVTKAGPMEITTLRKDKETDGRHAVVEFGASFEEDAARRDFTINAMSEDRHGQVYDYFSGRKDLTAGVLRFVGDAEQRITEDYLRILRYFRFWARFGKTFDEEAAEAIRKLAPQLRQVSQERITSEFLQILEAEEPEAVIAAMGAWGVLPQLLGSLKVTWTGINAKIPSTEDTPLYRLARMLGPDVTEEGIHKFATSFRLAIRQRKVLECYLCHWRRAPEPHASPAEKLDFWDKAEDLMGEENLIARTIPAWQSLYPQKEAQWRDLERCETEKGWLRRQKLPITGHDVAKVTRLEGPALGAAMKTLLTAFRNSLFSDRAGALEFLKQMP